MTSHRPPRMMTVRRWLALALLALFLVPVMTAMVIGIIVLAPTDGPRDLDSEISTRLTRDAGRWTDPAWQESLRASYGEDTAIILMMDGNEVFRTGDPMGGQGRRLVREITVPGMDPAQAAWVYSDPVEGPPRELRQWFVPVLLIGALILTFAAIAWFLRRSIVQPLEAASDAARQVARGELDIALPASRVREVDELARAFRTMSASLRASLEHRAAMEQQRKLFISAIAHDLRTPLFSLRGSLQGLQQGVARTPEQQQRYLDIALGKADQLERLIADLFTFTRMEYLGDRPEKAPLDLPPFLREVVGSARPDADAKNITLSVDGSGTDPVILADAHLLGRALGNILDNAIRHTPENAAIRLTWSEAESAVTITVEDTGPGFAPEDIPHLFEPLFRGDTSRNRATGGAGLGLTIAHRIITAHGGTLAASNADSGGAMLTITLPKG
jgi:signal transduction histidine kinase